MENQTDEPPITEANEIIATSSENHFNNSRLTAAAVLAFVPFSGSLGVHDFILKRYKKGAAHVVMMTIWLIPYLLVWSSCHRYNCFDGRLMQFVFLRYALSIVSYIWAVVEGVQILQYKKRSAMAQSMPPSEGDGDLQWQNKKRPGDGWANFSIVTTIFPTLIWLFCLISSGGSFNENGAGAVWWLLALYYMTIGFPLEILSIISGIVGLRSKLHRLAAASLLIKAVMILAIVLFFVL